MNTPSKSVNAWIILQDNMLASSSYQNLIQYKVFESVDMFSLCWVGTVPTSNTTVPQGNGVDYTILTSFAAELQPIVTDAKNINPDIKVLVMLGFNNPLWLSQIFSGVSSGWPAQATAFANNVVSYLQYYNLDGFDIDWESTVSDGPKGQIDPVYTSQVELVLSALRAAFNAQAKVYYLTISPAVADNLNGTNINDTVDFMNLQLYSGFTSASDFTQIGINQNILAYGSKFESYHQTAQGAYSDMQADNYSITTQWRLNSGNYQYEQAQQMILYQLVYGNAGNAFDDTPIIGAAGNPLITSMVIRSGNVLDAVQVTNTGQNDHVYTLLQHGGDGGAESVINIPSGDMVTEISGYTGIWYGWEVVLQITIKTAQGKTFGPFGTMVGATSPQAFTYKAPAGTSVVALSGSTVQVPEAAGGESFVVQQLNVTFA